MAITPAPTVPSRSTQTQAEFSENAENFLQWEADFAEELNSVSSTYYLSVTGTSTTSNTIGTGSKSFTTQTGLGFVVGNAVRIANSGTNYMSGDVTSYNSGTGALVVNVTGTSGSGTLASWTISLAAVGASAASDISVTPTGNISSTNVQSALAELDSEKLSTVTNSNLDDVVTGSTAGSNSSIPVLTINNKGRVTGISSASKIVVNSPVATTSGTSVTLTSSIPSTAKRVHLSINGVSLSGADNILIRLNGVTTGYLGGGSQFAGTVSANAAETTGFRVTTNTPAGTRAFYGNATIFLNDASNFIYSYSGTYNDPASPSSYIGAGVITLSGLLTTITIVSSGGSATFDAGSVTVSWE